MLVSHVYIFENDHFKAVPDRKIYSIQPKEYEKETTETVRGLFEEVEEHFYSEAQAIHPQSSVQACQLNILGKHW